VLLTLCRQSTGIQKQGTQAECFLARTDREISETEYQTEALTDLRRNIDHQKQSNGPFVAMVGQWLPQA